MPSQAESRVGLACSWGGEREGVFEREMRIFGGDGRDGHGDGDGDGEGTEDLRAPMLEVVFGLFDGLDYDDDAWC